MAPRMGRPSSRWRMPTARTPSPRARRRTPSPSSPQPSRGPAPPRPSSRPARAPSGASRTSTP
eukprot:4328359-Alexandrium_andersonii.AAC.1